MSKFLEFLGGALIVAAILGAMAIVLGADKIAPTVMAPAWLIALATMVPLAGTGLGCLICSIVLGDLRAIRTGIELQNASK